MLNLALNLFPFSSVDFFVLSYWTLLDSQQQKVGKSEGYDDKTVAALAESSFSATVLVKCLFEVIVTKLVPFDPKFCYCTVYKSSGCKHVLVGSNCNQTFSFHPKLGMMGAVPDFQKGQFLISWLSQISSLCSKHPKLKISPVLYQCRLLCHLLRRSI